jgi:hypothetical protein
VFFTCDTILFILLQCASWNEKNGEKYEHEGEKILGAIIEQT